MDSNIGCTTVDSPQRQTNQGLKKKPVSDQGSGKTPCYGCGQIGHQRKECPKKMPSPRAMFCLDTGRETDLIFRERGRQELAALLESRNLGLAWCGGPEAGPTPFDIKSPGLPWMWKVSLPIFLLIQEALTLFVVSTLAPLVGIEGETKLSSQTMTLTYKPQSQSVTHVFLVLPSCPTSLLET